MKPSPIGEGAPNNSRMGRALPDVPPVDLPLIHALLAATDALAAGRTTITTFQSQILELLRNDWPAAALAPWIERALIEQRDQVLARRAFPTRDDTIQVIYIAPGEVHPCHCHHNVTSTQVLLTGALHAREFDRIDAPTPETLRLRLLFDGMLAPGDVLQARDRARNAHWFAALDAPATLLNFNIRGYETDTFWPPETRPLGRRLLDPSPQPDGTILARIIPADDAYARFGHTPLAAFPMPQAAETIPRSLRTAS